MPLLGGLKSCPPLDTSWPSRETVTIQRSIIKLLFYVYSPHQIHSCGSVSSAQKLGNTPQSTQIFVGPHIRLSFAVLCLRPFPEQHNQPSDSTWSSSTSAVIITSPLHYLQLFCFIPEFKNLK